MVMERAAARRMTLRQLMTHSEKCTRDLIEHVTSSILTAASDFRDLSRPVRRRSHYPALVALMNALNKLEQAGQETKAAADYLFEQLSEIRERAQRERMSRM